MIPLICVLRYEYEVLIGLSGITGSDLYGELASAMLLQGRAVDMKSWGMHIKRYCLAVRLTSSIALAVIPLMSSFWNI